MKYVEPEANIVETTEWSPRVGAVRPYRIVSVVLRDPEHTTNIFLDDFDGG